MAEIQKYDRRPRYGESPLRHVYRHWWILEEVRRVRQDMLLQREGDRADREAPKDERDSGR